MIDISKITQTRAGQKVVAVEHYPDNRKHSRLFAALVDDEGCADYVAYYEDGKYWKNRESDMDLVEDEQIVTQDSQLADAINDIYDSILKVKK